MSTSETARAINGDRVHSRIHEKQQHLTRGPLAKPGVHLFAHAVTETLGGRHHVSVYAFDASPRHAVDTDCALQTRYLVDLFHDASFAEALDVQFRSARGRRRLLSRSYRSDRLRRTSRTRAVGVWPSCAWCSSPPPSYHPDQHGDDDAEADTHDERRECCDCCAHRRSPPA